MEESGDTLARQTVLRIRNAMQGGTFVGMPEVLRLIQELSTKAFSITLNELAEIIEQDVAVTARVIGSANTVGYNPSCTPVTTVSQSIQIIGFERVRNLAISYLLADSASQPLASDEQRETAAFALSSGLFAQALTEERDGDAELAFVCTAFRSYGRLLLTAYLIDDYRLARALAVEKGEDDAFRQVFGLTPLELSNALLEEFLIPRNVLRTLQRVPMLLAKTSTRRADDELFVLTEFSERVCELAMDASLDAGQFKKKADAICKSYGDSYRFNSDGIAPAFQSAVTHYTSFSQTYGIRRPKNDTIRLVAARSENANPPEDIVTAQQERRGRVGELVVNAEIVKMTAGHGKNAKKTNPAVVEAAVKRMESLIREDKPDVGAIQRLAITSFQNAVSLDCGMLLKIENSQVRVVAEVGEAANNLRRPVEGMTIDTHDVFGISILRKEDVLIEDVRIGNASRYLPVWLKLNSPVMSLLLLPILVDGNVAGLFFGLRCRGEPLGMNPATLQALRSMRRQIAQLWQGCRV